MLLRTGGEGSFQLEDTVLVPSWTESAAHWVSNIVSPPLYLLAITFLATISIPDGPVWGWVMTRTVFAILLPLAYLVRLYRVGAVSDLELNRRMERIRPLGASLTGALISLALLEWGQAPLVLVLAAGLCLLQTGVFLLITLWWKISAHALTATGLAVMSLFAIGIAAMPVIFPALLVAWSRVHLGAHTLSQTVAGATLGG